MARTHQRELAFVTGQNHVLEMIMTNAPITDILLQICRVMEDQYDDMACASHILEGLHLRMLAGPSLPVSYNSEIRELKIGPKAGSCGTAVYRREPVIVTDLTEDPLWEEDRKQALAHNFRACWASPIISSDDSVLGSFAMYFRGQRHPDAEDLKRLNTATRLARITLERHRFSNTLEAQFNVLLHSINRAICVADPQGICTSCNPDCVQLFGFEHTTDIVGQPLHHYIFSGADVPPLHNDGCQAPKLFGGREPIHYKEGSIKRANGRRLRIGFWCKPIFQGHANIGWIVIFEDIRTRFKINKKKRLWASKMDSLSLLFGGMAHDINNALTTILGNIALAKPPLKPTDPMTHRLADIKTEAMRLKDLTQQLLLFIKSGRSQKKPLALGELLKASAQLALAGSNIGCHFVLSENLWPIEGYAEQMSQAFQNLVIHARQAMPQGGMVMVRADNLNSGSETDQKNLPIAKRAQVQISIEYEGEAITPQQIIRILEPQSLNKETGINIRLNIACALLKNHGGQITIESVLGRGNVFTVVLPARPDLKVLSTTTHQKAKLRPGKGKILIMDDNALIRVLLAEVLWKCGYTFDVASDGVEAIALFRQAQESGHKFVAVILDLTVPGGMGGKEIIKKMRELDPNVKAIVSSGYANHPVMEDFRSFGFDGIVTKPFGMEQLSEVLRQVMFEGTP